MPEAALLPLAESVADGTAIDWDQAARHAAPADQGLVRQLGVLAELTELHRTLANGPTAPLPSAARRSQVAPAIGTWAHLTLLERLGGGTYGEVYRAWDRQLEREVALKLLKGPSTALGAGAAADDPETSRITREGRLLARVRHPNVITVHGVDVHEGRVGLWMELLRGQTLEQLLNTRGAFGAREAALVGIDLCRALAAIHSAGLLHRDVKAENVIREDGGRVVLMDFGTGREIDPSGRRRLPDLAGTPLYIAPEVFDGAPASEATDVYSLGVLLYHLVTGSFPVWAKTVEELKQKHARSEAIRLRDARADVPTVFVAVVDRAIAKNPANRYKTAGALEADLLKSIDDDTLRLTVTRSRAAVEEKSASVRRPLLAIGAIAAAIVVAGGALLAWPALRGRGTAPAAVTGAPIQSIAVLPLANMSGDPRQEYFADGMTDELIGTLGRLHTVNVISRTSSMQFKGTNKTLGVGSHLRGRLHGRPVAAARRRDGGCRRPQRAPHARRRASAGRRGQPDFNRAGRVSRRTRAAHQLERRGPRAGAAGARARGAAGSALRAGACQPLGLLRVAGADGSAASRRGAAAGGRIGAASDRARPEPGRSVRRAGGRALHVRLELAAGGHRVPARAHAESELQLRARAVCLVPGRARADRRGRPAGDAGGRRRPAIGGSCWRRRHDALLRSRVR
ncbi:MAG: hypothetical protein DMF87_15520 [Acidobacteria bacterium]|nr:MAG: hypothetical protein DMF87_15520 [Acidobacteriota bacterium]